MNTLIPSDLDLFLQKQEKGIASSAETRYIQAALAAEPTPDGIQGPSITPSPIGVPPLAYILHKHTSRCLACNATQGWSETFTLHHPRTHWNKTIKHLQRCDTLEWNIPLYTQDVAETTTPFCVECIMPTQAFIATLPKPPVPQAILNTVSRAPATPTAPAAKPKKAPPVSLDDLMS